MPVYMLFIREGAVRDSLALETYSRMNRSAPRDPNLIPRIVYGPIEAVEGGAPDGIVMLEFPTIGAAHAWYNSPTYQAALPYRKLAADYRAFIVEGLEPASPTASAATQ